MRILLVEPFFGGSHALWAQGWQKHSRHEIRMLTLKDKHWKWRMHGGAVTLARQFLLLHKDFRPDLIIASDMLDLSVFISQVRKEIADVPVVLYMHENQLSYPWSPTDPDPELQRDRHYAFINFTSALSADRVYFNSHFHRESFLSALPEFLKAFPDHQELECVEEIASKSRVLHLGLPLEELSSAGEERQLNPPLILWNHRWEYDKGPDSFFEALFQLAEEGEEFEVAVLGENYSRAPKIFNRAKEQLADRLVHFGMVSREEYIGWLYRAAILPITSRQDFFGISAVEAMYAGALPVLPNRLAFPEHLPEENRGQYLFQGQEQLLDKLRWALNSLSTWNPEELKTHLHRYDWSVMAPHYDLEMERVVGKE